MSIQSEKRRDQKKKAQKRKSTGSGGNSNKLFKKMTEDHLDLLQNIEFILVRGYRRDESIDDSLCRDALSVLLYDKICDDPRVQNLVDGLMEVREMQDEITDKLWRDALRVILQSIHTHSTLNSGSRGYLQFIIQYII
ncbi:MAG: hypothetical protein C4527_04760 [Candidatus Omnitrophota bacterium]|jgi:hypothetical protein|nr:MAG: hypothetical protein C4527_04760 [Candidatus Omnitrophota bacterium]